MPSPRLLPMPSSWSDPIDNYCERIDAGFWSEPLNAATNAAFILAAAYAFALWRRKRPRDWPSLWLIAVAMIIGLGSFLFHTFANRWSALADVLPIAVFIYSYFLLAMRRYLRFGMIAAIAVTAIFAGFNLSFSRLWFSLFPGMGLNGSVGYIPAALALLAVGCACWVARERQAGAALLLAAGVFALSLVFRSIDGGVCAGLPMGTHFLWHVLNGILLGILMRASITHHPREAPHDGG